LFILFVSFSGIGSGMAYSEAMGGALGLANGFVNLSCLCNWVCFE